MFRFDLNAPIYLGTADDAAQNTLGHTEDHLCLQLTVLTILGLRPIIGTPFLWQSPATLGAVAKSRDLFELELGPSLGGRPDTATANEYFRQREYDTHATSHLILRPSSAFKNERPGTAPLDWMSSIAPTTRIEPRNDSVEKLFRSLFIEDSQDLADQNSVLMSTFEGLGGAFSRVGRARTDLLLNKLGEKAYEGHFSRATVEHSYLSEDCYLPNFDDVLLRTSALYQAANGIAHGGSLFTTPAILNRIPRRLRGVSLSRFSISPLNPYLFSDLLEGIGVRADRWIRLQPGVTARIANTTNPLTMFANIYKQYLIQRLFDWHEAEHFPSYHGAVVALREGLFRDNEWEFLEKVALLPRRKFDSLIAGATGGAIAVATSHNPLLFAGAARQVIEYGYKLIDGLTFFDIIGMRRVLKDYLREIGLM